MQAEAPHCDLNVAKASHSSIDNLDSILGDILSFIRSDDWSRCYEIPQQERTLLKDFLRSECSSRVLDIAYASDRIALVLAGTAYVKQLPSYQTLQETYHRQITVQSLQRSGYPLSQFPNLTTSQSVELFPSDCAALQDWPKGRLAVAGSGRLENAGQFMKRLLEKKIYDKERYGELYLADLRTINEKLYLALSQWQTRTGEIILGKKQHELQDLALHAKNSHEKLSLASRSRLSNVRWRERKKITSN